MKNKSEKKRTQKQRQLESLLASAGVSVVDPSKVTKAPKKTPKRKRDATDVDDTRPRAKLAAGEIPTSRQRESERARTAFSRSTKQSQNPNPMTSRPKTDKQPTDRNAKPQTPNGNAEASATDIPVRAGFLLQCAPGLAKTLQRELNFVGAIPRDAKVFNRLQRNHDLMFIGQAKDETAFEKSRVAEMVLKCPAYGRFKISKRQLQIMADEVKALGPRRLVVSVAGRHFNRQDLGRFLARELEDRGAVIEDGIEDEVWMFCIDQDWYFGLPLKKARDTEGREAREEERRGALPPPIAAALAFAAMPRNDDVVLDPTCGSGTLLSEVHAYAPSAHLIGFDLDPGAIKIAKSNLKHVIESDLHVGDAREADIENANVTLTLANLPFGKQFGSKTTNAELYTGLLKKSLEMRDPDRAWRGIFLTSDDQAFAKASMTHASLKVETLFKVKIRGELATAYRASVS